MFCIWAMCDTWMRSRMSKPFLLGVKNVGEVMCRLFLFRSFRRDFFRSLGVGDGVLRTHGRLGIWILARRQGHQEHKSARQQGENDSHG